MASLLPAYSQENPAAEAEKLGKAMTDLYQKGDYPGAIKLALRVAEIYKGLVGEETPEYAACLNNLGLLYSAQGFLTEAESYYRRSLAIWERTHGPNDPTVASAVIAMAAFYRDQRRFTEAVPLYERGLLVTEKALGPDSPELAAGLNDLAEVFELQGRYGEAEALFRRSLAIRERTLGPEHPDVATTLNNLAFLYDTQGRYGGSEPLYLRSLAIREKALGPNDPLVALTLNNLGWLYDAQGRYEESEPLYRRSLAIREKTLGPDDPEVATSLNNLAALCDALGRYAEAENLYRRSLTIMERSFGSDHPDVATSLDNLALLFAEQGRYAEAEPLHKRAQKIFEKALGPDDPRLSTSLNNLALLYANQGRYAEAEALYQRSLAIRAKRLGPEHPDVASGLSNLAQLLKRQGRYAEAEPLMTRSLAIWEKALGPDHPGLSVVLNNLAGLYGDLARDAEGEALYRRCLAILEKTLGPDHPNVAICLNGLGGACQSQGRYGEAKSFYSRGLAIFEKTLGPDHPNTGAALFSLAELLYAEGSPVEAERFFARWLRNLSRQFEYGFTYMSEGDRLRFLDTMSHLFNTYFSFCMSSRDKLPALAGKMYDVVLWEKGLIAQSVAALRAKVLASGDAEALLLLDGLTEKQNELAKLVSSVAEPDAPRQAARRARIEKIEAKANEIETELVRRSAALGEEKRLARISWPQVRDALKPEEAAVEIVRFLFHSGKAWTDKSYYVALVLRPESREPTFIVLGEKKELERVPLTDYRRLVAAPEGGGARAAKLGNRFYEAFWLPLEPSLGKAKRVYISPDGELNQVSIGVSPGRDGRPLMETLELRTVNSTKDLLRTAPVASGGRAVLVGNPVFALSEDAQRAAVRSSGLAKPGRAATGEGPGSVSLRSRDLRGGALGELTGAGLEIDDIAAILRGAKWSVLTYTGEEALEERVKGVSRPRVLHLATHGFFEADLARPPKERAALAAESGPSLSEDPMLRSGIYLAGANRAIAGEPLTADLEDGVLTAFEASQLNLQGTELVVLSACETGLGKTEAGEGVFGLRRALQVAGAETVMMSLWTVPDAETRELMALFYGKWLAGADKHQALREAQLEMREKVKARYGADLPLFWAAFILVGR